MDHLVLIAVASELARELPGAVLHDFRQETEHRCRAVFLRGDGAMSLVLSVRPQRPWVGRPDPRTRGRRDRTTAFAAAVRRLLGERVVDSVSCPQSGRVLRFGFAGGHALVVELVPHRANVIALDGDGRVVAAARRTRRERDRIEVGEAYRPPAPPRDRVDPTRASAAAIDRAWRERTRHGAEPSVALRAALVGVEADAAGVVLAEAVAADRTPGDVLADRVARLAGGEDVPVVELSDGTDVEPGRTGWDPATCRLLPWEPHQSPPPGFRRSRKATPAATSGWFHDGVERWLAAREQATGLHAILRSEIRRAERRARRIASDRRAFADPDAHRLQGEALLAGMHVARRDGATVRVPDPYDESGRWLELAVAPDRSLAHAEDDRFARYRRAVRGIREADRRLAEIRARIDRMCAVERRFGGAAKEDLDRLEDAMRELGLAVGLGEQRRARVAVASPAARPRLAGVRIFRSRTDETILVGKTARDNHYLTFRVGRPEDFWLHALGVPGAHVLVRNPDRKRAPDGTTLTQAAGLAAWFSEAKTQPLVDVQWTRRKYVRRARKGAPGAVVLKRFETVRVAPCRPRRDDGGDA